MDICTLFIAFDGCLVVVLKLEYIKTILSNPDEFVRTDYFKTFVPLFGNGLLTATSDDHRYQKKVFFKTIFSNTNEILCTNYQQACEGFGKGTFSEKLLLFTQKSWS